MHGIFASEILGYDVVYEPIDLNQELDLITEDSRITDTLQQLVRGRRNKISLGVWLTPGYDGGTAQSLEMIGRFSTGHYGWFVPKRLLTKLHLPPLLSFNLFTSSSNAYFDQFIFDTDILSG